MTTTSCRSVPGRRVAFPARPTAGRRQANRSIVVLVCQLRCLPALCAGQRERDARAIHKMRAKLVEFGIDPDTLRPVATSFGPSARRGRLTTAASESEAGAVGGASELAGGGSAPVLPSLHGMPSSPVPGGGPLAPKAAGQPGGAAGQPGGRHRLASSAASSGSRGCDFFAQHTMGVLRAQREALARSMLAMSGGTPPSPARRALHAAGSAVVSTSSSSRGSASVGLVG